MQVRSFSHGAAVAVILINTLVGLTLGVVVDAVMEPAMGWMIFGVLCVVAVSEIMVVRLVVITNIAAIGQLEDPPTVEVATASLTALISTFAVAPSIYGIVCAVFMGSPWPTIPLSAIGLLLLALNAQHASTRLAAARRELSARGVV